MASGLALAIFYVTACHQTTALTFGIKPDGETSVAQSLMRERAGPAEIMNVKMDADVDAKTYGEVENLVHKLVAESNASVWPFTNACDPLVDMECRKELPHEEPAIDGNDKLWHAAFEEKMTVGAFKDSTSDIQVWHRDKIRSLDLISSNVSLPMMRWTSLNCGDLDTTKPMTCEAQPCTVSKDPENFGMFKNFKEIVSVGPGVFGSALKKVALIGSGGGILVHFLTEWSPDVTIDAVEYSPKVASASKACFAFPTSSNVQLAVQDGIAFLESKPDGAYDWIIIDASGSLDRFGTPDAHKLYKRLLGPKGAVTFNTAGFQKFPQMVTQALLVAKKEWKGAFKTARDFSYTFSDADLLSAKPSQGDTPNAFQQATTTWFGAGLTELTPGWR